MEVKPSLEDLLKAVYQYYPRAPSGPDHTFDGFAETEEHRRLVAARIRAGTENSAWRAMLDRLRARFPDAVEDRAFHLPSGNWDGAYIGKLALPIVTPEVEAKLTFMVSFLVSYYVIYRERWVSPPPGSPPPDGKDKPDSVRYEESFAFTDEEAPYARAVAEEIEATFGHAPMPPTLGRTIVPDAWFDHYSCGTVPLFHYLFATLVPA